MKQRRGSRPSPEVPSRPPRPSRQVRQARQAAGRPSPRAASGDVEIEGTYKGHPKGFGFMRPIAHSIRRRSLRIHDLFVPRGAAGDAIDGDRVLARPGERGTARVTAVLERGRRKLAGTFLEGGAFRPDSPSIPRTIPLREPIVCSPTPGTDSCGPDVRPPPIAAVPGDKVVAAAQGKDFVLAEVLGRAGDPAVEDRAVLEEMEIGGDFPPAVLREVERFSSGKVTAGERRGRLDLRGEPTVVTIDPLTAKDFDDAISLRRERDGGYLLGVHIADVSHYVVSGSAADREAERRGLSAYLPQRVIPMLPPVLSDGLCSLREGEDRLAISVLLSHDARGRLRGSRVARSVIRSQRRFTYERASRVMEGAGGEAREVAALLRDMHSLAGLLRAKSTALPIHEPGVEFVYTPGGDIADVSSTEGDDAHWVIEEFMLAANREVAGWLLGLGEPVLFRHHPPLVSLDELRGFLAGMGIPGARERPLPELLRRAGEAGLLAAATSFLMEAMEAAEYSPKESSHSALGFPHYTHFTSPIRRYADLMVHRAVGRRLRAGLWMEMKAGKRAEGAAPASTPDLERLAEHLNLRERAVDHAESRLRRRRVLDFLAKRAAERLQGVVLKTLEDGLLVNLPGYLISGFVDLESLGAGARRVEPYKLTARGKTYRPGQEMLVRLKRVDPVRGDLDLEPA